jgi:hypothetical protein
VDQNSSFNNFTPQNHISRNMSCFDEGSTFFKISRFNQGESNLALPTRSRLNTNTTNNSLKIRHNQNNHQHNSHHNHQDNSNFNNSRKRLSTGMRQENVFMLKSNSEPALKQLVNSILSLRHEKSNRLNHEFIRTISNDTQLTPTTTPSTTIANDLNNKRTKLYNMNNSFDNSNCDMLNNIGANNSGCGSHTTDTSNNYFNYMNMFNTMNTRPSSHRLSSITHLSQPNREYLNSHLVPNVIRKSLLDLHRKSVVNISKQTSNNRKQSNSTTVLMPIARKTVHEVPLIRFQKESLKRNSNDNSTNEISDSNNKINNKETKLKRIGRLFV